VKNLLKASRCLTQPDSQHHPRRNCACIYCSKDRARGCENPHKCAKNALTILNNLAPLYNPDKKPPKDGLSLTHRRLEKNQQAIIHCGDEITFNPSVTSRSSLSDCLRIFAAARSAHPPPFHRPPQQLIPPSQITVYTDGSCISNGNNNARSGCGIWLADDHPQNKALRVPGQWPRTITLLARSLAPPIFTVQFRQ